MTKTRRMTGGEIIVESLIAEGVTHCFGIPGHGDTALIDAFVDHRDEITLLPAMHEQNASHMADGFFRASGRVAAVITSIGPGATNTLTGVATAYADSIPQLVITGGVHTYMTGRGVLQELDRTHSDNFPRMAEPTVKRWFNPATVAQIPNMMEQAFNAMLGGRMGPVLVNVPQDLQAEADEVSLQDGARRRSAAKAYGDPAYIDRAADMLLASDRPLLVAGGGVILAEACAVLRELAEFLDSPVTTSFQGKSAFPEDHPLFANAIGDMGSLPGNHIARTADVILAVGCRFSDRITSSYRQGVTFDIPKTKLIQVDIDGFEIGKNYPVEVGILGDAKAVLGQLLAALKAKSGPRDRKGSAQLKEMAGLKSKWEDFMRPLREADARPMTLSKLLVETRKALPRETIVVTDSSSPQNQVFNEFPVHEPRTHITAGGMSGIGFALPAAIGAKIARPDLPVCAIFGDGAFLQTGTELATAAMTGAAVIFIVVNNGGWIAIRNLQLNLFGEDREIITRFQTPNGAPWMADAAGMARSLGVAAETVTDPAGIGPSIQRALDMQKPYLIDVHTAIERPWSGMHVTGWWDITVPEYSGEKRDAYVKGRGF